MKYISIWNVLGFVLVLLPPLLPWLRNNGYFSIGDILGILLIVFSLFGELPNWISWTQVLGEKMYNGIAIATIVFLFFYIIPTNNRQSSFFAFSPSVWLAYSSIIIVTLSFRFSPIPKKIYEYCKNLEIKTHILIPLFVFIAGLLGNVFDGVTIISISVIIFLVLLDRKWAIKSSFALLFGGLTSNLITVAAEPTNIKFDDILHNQIARIHPYFWVTNWPISILGILFPTLILSFLMYRNKAKWNTNNSTDETIDIEEVIKANTSILFLSIASITLLALGVILHTIFSSYNLFNSNIELWIFLLPSGIVGLIDILYMNKQYEFIHHIRQESKVWTKLMVIFSLLWVITNISINYKNIFSIFFTFPFVLRYILMIILSLASSVTDNVALASMQVAIMLYHPIAVWQMRLIFLILSWAGGLTSFGCLQSLSLNSHIRLNTKQWFNETLLWASISLIGSVLGLILTICIYH